VEDIELGYRLRAAGHRIALDQGLQATHLKAWSLGSLLRSDIFDRALPWARLILGRRGLIDDLNLRRADRLSAAAACTGLAALGATPWLAPAGLAAAAAALALLALNADLYRFFARRRGIGFAVGAAAAHWLYLVYSALAFAAAALGFALRRRG
jgi:hypothetical protein